MINNIRTYFTSLMLSAMALVACSDESSIVDAATDVVPEAVPEGNILTLRIGLSVPSGHTRATSNPSGGETGDGTRLGLYNENNINDVYLYKYSSADGINAADNTPVTLLAFHKDVNFKPTADDLKDEKYVKELKFNVGSYLYESTNNDHFIVAINTDMLGQNTTLGRLRNELILYTCRQKGTQMKDYEDFAMSNAHDSKFESGTGTEDDPYIVSIDVERLTARLDFAYSSAAQTAGNFRIDGGKYIYKVLNNGTPTGDEVHLTHVRATNVNQAAPYLIKRLAASESETPVYLADETPEPSSPTADHATKYVVEPSTWSKTIEAAKNKSLSFSYWFRNSWYKTAHSNYNSTSDPWFRDADKVHCGSGDAFTDGTTLDEKDHDWNYYVLDYANENTMVAEQTHQDYTTGLILKATYFPKDVYKAFDAESETLTVDGAYTVGTTFWRCHEVDTNTDLYFSVEAAANAYQDYHPLSVVYKYEGAQCYYNVWLRHENVVDDPTTTMMEFGIVRNNIYRVCVEFSGIGMPDVPDDMVTPETIRMYIFVRKWNLIEHPVIEI